MALAFVTIDPFVPKLFVCFVCHVKDSQTMTPLATFLVPLESLQ